MMVVALFLTGLSMRSAVSAGGSDEEVFPPKTLEKLKKNISNEIYSVAGGGDTVSLLNDLNATNNFDFVSDTL